MPDGGYVAIRDRRGVQAVAVDGLVVRLDVVGVLDALALPAGVERGVVLYGDGANQDVASSARYLWKGSGWVDIPLTQPAPRERQDRPSRRPHVHTGQIERGPAFARNPQHALWIVPRLHDDRALRRDPPPIDGEAVIGREGGRCKLQRYGAANRNSDVRSQSIAAHHLCCGDE